MIKPYYRTLLLLGLAIGVAVYKIHPPTWHTSRYAQLRCVIDRHTGFAHMTRGMNTETVHALRSATTDADIPLLISMLKDKDHVIQLTAAATLAEMGSPGLAALQNELARMGPKYQPGDDYRRREIIEDALRVKI